MLHPINFQYGCSNFGHMGSTEKIWAALQSCTGKYRGLQGNPCNENRIPAMRTGFPVMKTCFSLWELTYREFPVSLTGLVWVCSVIMSNFWGQFFHVFFGPSECSNLLLLISWRFEKNENSFWDLSAFAHSMALIAYAQWYLCQNSSKKSKF